MVNDGFDMGGAGPAVRTGMSCVGAARCEMSNTNEQAALRTLVNAFLDDMHMPLSATMAFHASWLILISSLQVPIVAKSERSIEFIQSLAQPETLNFILYGNAATIW
jgi:hypothetical protein